MWEWEWEAEDRFVFTAGESFQEDTRSHHRLSASSALE